MCLSYGKKGLMGFDVLILLTAVILGALFIAFVLFQATQEMGKGLSERETTDEKIGHPIVVEYVRGLDNDGDRRIDQIVWVIRSGEKNPTIQFNNTVIQSSSDVVNCTLTYGAGGVDRCKYSVRYTRQGFKWKQDYFSPGDMAEITYSNPIPGIEDINGRFIFSPDKGIPTMVEVDIPQKIMHQNTILWPTQ